MRTAKIANTFLFIALLMTIQRDEAIYFYASLVFIIAIFIISIIEIKRYYNNDGLLKEQKFNIIKLATLGIFMICLLFNKYFM